MSDAPGRREWGQLSVEFLNVRNQPSVRPALGLQELVEDPLCHLHLLRGLIMSESYLPTHEWARAEGNLVVIGLSPFAAGEVGEVIHVQLPAVGSTLSRGKPCAEIESVKSVNDYYSPIDGSVVEINAALANNPELVNSDPLKTGWFAKIKPAKPDALVGLLSTAEYQAKITK